MITTQITDNVAQVIIPLPPPDAARAMQLCPYERFDSGPDWAVYFAPRFTDIFIQVGGRASGIVIETEAVNNELTAAAHDIIVEIIRKLTGH